MSFTLPELGYATDALVRSIDQQTMEIHHGKHHNAYVGKLNDAIGQASELDGKSLDELLANDCAIVPEAIRGAVREGRTPIAYRLNPKTVGPHPRGSPETPAALPG